MNSTHGFCTAAGFHSERQKTSGTICNALGSYGFRLSRAGKSSTNGCMSSNNTWPSFAPKGRCERPRGLLLGRAGCAKAELQIHCRRPVSRVGHLSSIAVIISSAHRTASEIAEIVAGTLLPPSCCESFRAARNTGGHQQHALTPLVHSGMVACSPFVRHMCLLPSLPCLVSLLSVSSFQSTRLRPLGRP